MTSPGKYLVPAALATGTLFAVLTAPLALFGSQPIDIHFKGERVFEGRLRDVGTPYVGFVSLLGLGAGVASLAITGWRQAARESEATKQKLAEIERQLKQKERQLQEALLSKDYLEQSGLKAFLEGDQESLTAPTARLAPSAPPKQSTYPVPPATAPLSAVSGQTAAASHAAAQAFMGFSRSAVAPASAPSAASPDNATMQQIHELQVQLQQILTQIKALQGNLQPNAQPTATQAASVEAAGARLVELAQAIDPSWSLYAR